MPLRDVDEVVAATGVAGCSMLLQAGEEEEAMVVGEEDSWRLSQDAELAVEDVVEAMPAVGAG
jgi:hypothetical protein